MKTILIVGFLILISQTQAAKIDEITFPESLTVNGQTLKLNGLGLRKATVFKVKVYAAALYVSEPSKNAETLLKSGTPKVLVMKFMRDVSKEKINEAWDKAFEENPALFKTQIQTLKKIMPDAKEGDSFEYLFAPDRTEIKVNNSLKSSMEGGDWGTALLSTWLGKNPPTEDLKKGLLGAAD